MANKTTMTQVIALATAIEVLGTMPEHAEVVEKLSAMKQTIENKRSTPSKAQTAKAEETAGILSCIMDILTTAGKPMMIAEMQSASPALAEFTNQRMSAMLKKLVDTGRVVKTVEKGKSLFSLAESEEE